MQREHILTPERGGQSNPKVVLLVLNPRIWRQRRHPEAVPKLEFLYDIHANGILLNAAGGKTSYPLLKKISEEGIRFVC